MATITVQAVYHKGALRPKKKLDLPEDALVEVQVTPLESSAVVSGAKTDQQEDDFFSLAGLWSGREVTLDSIRQKAWPPRQ